MDSKYTFIFTETALADLDSTIAYITNELCNDIAAKNLYEQTLRKIDLICSYPDAGVLVNNKYLLSSGIRKIAVNNYILYYFPNYELKQIEVLRFVYSKRNMDKILETM